MVVEARGDFQSPRNGEEEMVTEGKLYELVLSALGDLEYKPVQLGVLRGVAVRANRYVVDVLSFDPRIRIGEFVSTGVWVDGLLGTAFLPFGGVLIWFLRDIYLPLPLPAARFLFGDEQVATIPTPVGIDTEMSRDEVPREGDQLKFD